MCIKKYYITLILLLLGASIAYPQEFYPERPADSHRDGALVNSADTIISRSRQLLTNIEVHFRHDKHYLDLQYMGNKESLLDFSYKIDSIGISHIDSVVIVSQSSPEGNYERNARLSENRANTMRSYLLGHHPELFGRLYVHADGESWGRLREYVKNDTHMTEAAIEAVLAIIDSDVAVDTKKKQLQQLPVYDYLLLNYYPRIRNSAFSIYYQDIDTTIVKVDTVDTVAVEPIEEVAEVAPDTTTAVETVEPTVERWRRKLHLKTNALGLGMAIANAGIEIDLAKHWSFALPVYYSAWDYFKTTIKFRTAAIHPELRYWLSQENDGLFFGTHFGMAYYNFAFDGDYRYQDHNRETPAIGGGLSVGYRLPISESERWWMEFSLGAGGYALNYDIFHNTPNTKEGLMVESSVKKIYWGVDRAAVSFSYSFNLGKKGGKR